MLAIRLQRTGRRGHPMYRLIVQDARRTPTSGNIVTQLGHYNPHTKEVALNKIDAEKFLSNGAQPSPRAQALMEAQGVTMPVWVTKATAKSKAIRNPEKLRRNQPAPEAAPEETPAVTGVTADENVGETTVTE